MGSQTSAAALGAALGTSASFFFDPISGARRRALLLDQLNHALHVTADLFGKAQRDVEHRYQGWRSRLAHPLAVDQPDDSVLQERVRSKLGRYVSHPGAIDVQAHEGTVTIRGLILTDEVQPLVRALKRMPEIRHLDNQLEAHETGENISALQGGRVRHGPVPILARKSWSPSLRLAIAGLGLGLLLIRKPLLGATLVSFALYEHPPLTGLRRPPAERTVPPGETKPTETRYV